MKLKIIEDSVSYPHLFFWYGNIAEDKLRNWLDANDLSISEDYFEFLEHTGGGDIFESETLLGPFGDSDKGDDIIGTTDYHHRKGMPNEYLVFHVGMSISVIHLNTRKFCVLGDNHIIKEQYENFDDWYRNFIRKEFASRYGLSNYN